jgi:SpoVK/Ycf46/Vps4 family AAA+-type ATPase
LSSNSSYSSLSYLSLCYQYQHDLSRHLISLTSSSSTLVAPLSSSSNSLSSHSIHHSFFGHTTLKDHLLHTLLYPRLYAPLYSLFHLPATHGLLLYGPPGTGKTYLISLIAQHLSYTFINIKLSAILSGEIGSSEQKIRDIFYEAKRAIPCIIFIDEFQALFSSSDSTSSSSSSSSLLTTLSGCIDDLQLYNQYANTPSPINTSSPTQPSQPPPSSSNIILIAATNEPWKVDKSFLRVGRFDRLLHVGLMDTRDREQLISQLLQRTYEKLLLPVVTHNVDERQREKEEEVKRSLIEELVTEMSSYTTADICYVFQKVEGVIVKRLITQSEERRRVGSERGIGRETGCGGQISLQLIDFQKVLKDFIPSCSSEEIEEYLQWEREVR